MKVDGFSGLTRLHEGGQAVVFRARRDRDGLPVVLKLLRSPYPSAEALQRFRREAAITRTVQGPGVVGLHDAMLDGAAPLMVLEDFGGDSLALVLQREGRLPARQVAALAVQAVDALARVHDLLVVHKDLSPGNLVWHPPSGRLALIDFGIASTVSRQQPELASPSELRGTLPFIAPEQTGRMNRSVDYRSDYYGLGATLYALLTGQPPFSATEPLELVHAHVARRPRDPRELVPGVPGGLSAVILKLLEKSADARYQSAFGLRHDLLQCLEGPSGGGDAARAFTPGLRDRPARVQLPGRLYGRDAEVAALEAALHRVAAGGRELVLVEGGAGIGKTALVRELHPPMVDTGGLFVSGKFDQFRRGLPYGSLSAAFGQLFLRLMTGSESEVAAWRERLQRALGDSAQAVVDLVPELELLLGPQPPAPSVPPADAEQRLHRLFLRVVQTLARDGAALVLFVDDLQWADLPTLRLFRRLAEDADTTHLLLVGAWRDDEIGPGHPLVHLLEELRGTGVRTTSLRPEPLRQADVERFLADTLHQEGPELRDLASTCLARTAGNPFFLAQFVRMLEQAGAIRFDHADGRWHWDPDAVRAFGATDNVVALMTTAIEGLPAASREALRAASLLGSVVPLRDLAALLQRSPGALRRALHPVLETGLLIRIGESLVDQDEELADDGERYGFVHDRVQQAAYGLLAPGERAALHLRAGRMLQARHADPTAHEDLFEVVDHLLAARDLLQTDEVPQVAALALAAGRRARSHAATGTARTVVAAGLELLGPTPFADARTLATDLHHEAAISAYLDQDYDASEQHVGALLAHAEGALARVLALETRMAAQVARNQSAEAITTGIQALRELGVDMPEAPDLDAVMAAMQACWALVAQADLASVATGTPVSDPAQQTVMRLLNALTPPAYLVRPLLLPLLAAALVRISVEEGIGPESAYGFAMYGLVLCDAGFLDEGHGMGQLALGLAERFPDERRVRLRTHHVCNGFVRHWKEPLHRVLDDYAACFPEGLDIGDFEYAHFVAMLVTMYGLESGRPLDVLEPQVARYTASHIALAQDASLVLHGIAHQALLNLMGRAEDDTLLVGEISDERRMGAIFEELAHDTGLFVLHHFRCFVLYALGELDAAADAADRARASMQAGGTATFHLVVFAALDGLLALREVARSRDEAALARALACEVRLERWAAACPENAAHKLALVRGARARVEGDLLAAQKLLGSAARQARAQRFLYDEAIAHRMLAELHDELGDNVAARAHLLESRYAFQRWGARAVVARIDRAHPTLAMAGQGGTVGDASTTWTDTAGSDLDAATVLRASRAISQELVLSRLVQLLVRLGLESSGARRAALLLERDGNFLVTVVGHADPEVRTQLLEPWVAAGNQAIVPAAVVQYVRNTGRELLIADARSDALFAGDEEVARLGIRSMLALPVVHQGRLRAILYLDNDQSPGVFTGERLGLARVLLGQAAISLENAVLYEELEARVRERTRQLEEARAEAERAHQQSDTLLKNTLPAAIAEELKATGRARPVSVEAATVLFTDFVDFTHVAADLSATELVDALEACFTAFDGVIERWGLEKLKTIGDAYMAVGGVPSPTRTHVLDCVMAGLEIVRFMEARSAAGTGVSFAVRVGLHTGPLVAGVIGKRRFAYDVWGHTVNMASRLESAGEAGRVNISAESWAPIAHLFEGRSRGRIAVKGHHDQEMIFVDRLRPAYSVGGDGITPNDAFWEARRRLGTAG